MVPHLKRPIDILFSLLKNKIVSDENITGQTLLHKEGRSKGGLSWGSLSILSQRNCPTPKMVLSRIDVLNPRARKHWNAPPEKFETPLEYYGLLCRNDVCTIIWLLQLVKQVQSLSSFAPAHPFQSSGHTWIHSLAGAITWFSFLWVGSLVPTPNSLGMRLVGQT